MTTEPPDDEEDAIEELPSALMDEDYDEGYDVVPGGDPVQVPSRICVVPDCGKNYDSKHNAVAGLFGGVGGPQGWIKNRLPYVPSPTDRWRGTEYEYFCPDHAPGNCKHGKVKGETRIGELILTFDEDRPAVVCRQCNALWICTPADELLVPDKLPLEVLADMIALGRYQDAAALFHEFLTFAAHPAIPKHLVSLAEGLERSEENLHGSIGRNLAREVIIYSQKHPAPEGESK